MACKGLGGYIYQVASREFLFAGTYSGKKTRRRKRTQEIPKRYAFLANAMSSHFFLSIK